MNNNFRHWMEVTDNKVVPQENAVTEQAESCECRLYTCQICFPNNYVATHHIPTQHMSSLVERGEIVGISDIAGGGRGEVIDIKGEYLSIKRESDNIDLLIHESDIVKESVGYNDDLMCKSCGSMLGSAEFFPRGEVSCGKCGESTYNRFGYDPLEDEPGFDQYESMQEDLSDADRQLLRYYSRKYPHPYDRELDSTLSPDAAKLAYFKQKFPAPYSYELEEEPKPYATMKDGPDSYLYKKGKKQKLVGSVDNEPDDDDIEISEEELDLFDRYCDLSAQLNNGRIRGRSTFLAMSPEEQQKVVADLEAKSGDDPLGGVGQRSMAAYNNRSRTRSKFNDFG